MKNQNQSTQIKGVRKPSILFGAVLFVGAFNAQASDLVDLEKTREADLKERVLQQYLKDTSKMCSDRYLNLPRRTEISLIEADSSGDHRSETSRNKSDYQFSGFYLVTTRCLGTGTGGIITSYDTVRTLVSADLVQTNDKQEMSNYKIKGSVIIPIDNN